MTTIDILKKTKAAWKHINNASAETKNALLLAMADSLEWNRAVILVENRADMEAAVSGREAPCRYGGGRSGHRGAVGSHGAHSLGGAPAQRHDHL